MDDVPGHVAKQQAGRRSDVGIFTHRGAGGGVGVEFMYEPQSKLLNRGLYGGLYRGVLLEGGV